jgi:ABC-2 type transport system permease protein
MDGPESVMMVSQLVSFPLLFLSNVFVDPATMPEFLQKFVNINPVTLTATAVRGLMQGTVTTAQISAVLLSSTILVAIFAPVTMILYNNKNTS